MRSIHLPILCGVLLAACAGPARTAAPGDAAHLDAMSREHAGHTPTANASADAPRQEVVTREVEYVVDGERVRGYEARPASAAVDARLPAVIVVHEWWGLNDNVKMMTRRLAGEGYRAFAVDMYHGRVAETPEQARPLMQEVMQDPDRGIMHVATASLLLRQAGAQRVGIMGWCFGGGWALRGALEAPEQIDAAVMYYGQPVTDRERLARLDAPLLGLFGVEDRGIPAERVREMEATLRELGKDATIQIYEGAGHGFGNPSGETYRADAAEDAWRRTIAFFGRHLR